MNPAWIPHVVLQGMATPEQKLRYSGLNCPACGYDLRGLSKPKCPECGRRFNPETIEMPIRFSSIERMVACVSILSATAMSAWYVRLAVGLMTRSAAQVRYSNDLWELEWLLLSHDVDQVFGFLGLPLVVPVLTLCRSFCTDVRPSIHRVARCSIFVTMVSWAICYCVARNWRL